MAIISYVTTKKGDSKNEGKAIAAAAAAGLGSYWFTTETEWGQDAVSWLDDNIMDLSSQKAAPVTVDQDGNLVQANTGLKPGSASTNGWDVLKNWGPTGTAAVVGTGAVTAGLSSDDWIKWAAIAVGVFLLIK